MAGVLSAFGAKPQDIGLLHCFRARFERSPLSTYTSLGSQDTFNEGVTNRVSSTCIEAILQQHLCILPLQKYLRRNVCKRNLKARTLLKRALSRSAAPRYS